MESKKNKRRRRTYDASFKQDVLKMIESGRSVPDVAKALGVTSSL
ncbi:transposase, partial [Flavitalea antarctica]